MAKGIPINGLNKGWFKKGQRPINYGTRKYKPKCQYCNTLIDTSDARSKYCSHSCAMKYRWKTNKPKLPKIWNKGKKLSETHKNNLSIGKYKGKGLLIKGKSANYWRSKARQIIDTKNKDLVIHHIDGNVTNNNLNNLAVMSRAEHTKLHHLQGDIRGGDYNRQ